MKPMLDIKDLRVSFHSHGRKVEALQGVSLKIFDKQKIGIVGESGSGKTVLAKAILRLLPLHSAAIESGEILYKGENLLKLTEKQMQAIRGKEVGMILQDPMTSLNPTLTIGNQIAESIILHNRLLNSQEVKIRVLQLLVRVGIPEPDKRFHEYPHTLSGGIRQRVLIALALATDPAILIADEPTTALDVTVQAQIFELLHLLQKDKSTILITHDLSVVAGFCDRVIVMYAGKIVEDAPVGALFSSPQHPYTQKLLLSIPRLDLDKETLLVPIAGSPPVNNSQRQGCSFCQRCTYAMNICKDQEPPLFSVGKNHLSSCWRHDARNSA